MTKIKTYVSGPMSKRVDFNFPNFDSLSEQLRGEGIEVFSPADHDREVIDKLFDSTKEPDDFDGFAVGDVERYTAAVGRDLHRTLFSWDFTTIMKCNRFDLLPEWEGSTGCRWERCLAEALHIPIHLATWSDTDAYWFTSMDEVQDRLTQYLRDFNTEPFVVHREAELYPPGTHTLTGSHTFVADDLTPAYTPLSTCTPRDLLAALNSKLGHISAFREPLAKIDAGLA